MTAWGMLVMWSGIPFPRRKLEKESVKLLQLWRKRSYAWGSQRYRSLFLAAAAYLECEY